MRDLQTVNHFQKKKEEKLKRANYGHQGKWKALLWLPVLPETRGTGRQGRDQRSPCFCQQEEEMRAFKM